ncbi:MAG: molecular chaperone TorD family protein [Deltaproteobacteria bacterium]|nr:molecular chaperone TorD family protein [Deltaproteobacteria bacterium]
MKVLDPYLRSEAYKALSVFYRYPDESILEEWKRTGEDAAASLQALSSRWKFLSPENVQGFLGSMEDLTPQELQAEYVRLFDYRPPCPLFESSYVKPDRSNPGEVQLLVERMYNAFDLDSTPSDPPDHLTLEMEFMHFLTFQEAEAVREGNGDVEKYRSAQKSFHEEHIQGWVPDLCERLQSHAGLPLFRFLGALTAEWIANEAGYIDQLCRDVS